MIHRHLKKFLFIKTSIIVICLYAVLNSDTEHEISVEDEKVNGSSSTMPTTQTIQDNIIEELLRRRTRIRNTCGNKNTNENKVLTSRYVMVIRRLYIDTRHNITWCPIFKAASSTIMRIYASLSGLLTKERELEVQRGHLQLNQLVRKAFPSVTFLSELQNNEKFSSSGNKSSLWTDVDQYNRHFKKEQQKLTSLANKEFGLNSWSHSVTKQDIDCVDYVDGSYSVAASAVVKVVLKQSVYHEELGCGFSFGLASKAISIANARQEAKIDAFKKALASFNPDMEFEENLEQDKSSSVKGTEFSWECKTPFRPQQTSKPQIISSPQNVGASVSCTSPKVTFPVKTGSELLEQRDIRAERKRKQQQLQEEYRSRMKLKEKLQFPPNKENSNAQLLMNATDDEEPAFLSTQDVDEMMKSAAVFFKSECPAYRMPLLSSPVQNTDRGWSIDSGVKTSENNRNGRFFVN